MDILKNINLGVAFLSELFMLTALVWGGFSLHVSTLFKILVGVVAPIVIIVLWSMFFAPQASVHRMPTPWLQLAQITLFGTAAYVLSRGGHAKVAVIYIAIAFVSLILGIIWKQ
ncbi:MAG: YrdB family protein [Candidatus Saccharibacteria bacterium]